VFHRFRILLLTALLLLPAPHARTQSPAAPVTSPLAQFGAAIGDDYFLATYSQLEAYWKTLDRESDRMQLVDIGRTEEGRTQWMAVISAPENLQALDRYREISRRLAVGEGLADEQARALANDGKAVVWIDGGLHADEVLGSHQLIELVYRLLSRDDAETRRILRDVIVLAVHPNPDGHELVASWYMRERDPLRRTLGGVPRAYQKYVGHDNNRDFYLNSQAETINMSRVLYTEWFPQIVFDHHQTGPRGTVMFAPPFREPFNYVLDPLIPVTIDLVGAAMHTRFAAEAKPGVTMRSGSTYSTWWNGGLRTTAYFHNQIGLLTETIGSPTPTEIPFVAERQLPSADLPFPIAPQRWRFRQSIEYSMTANWAVLDFAARYRETLLFNAFKMASNAIQKGSQDSWTVTPHQLAARVAGGSGASARPDGRAPQHRDPRGYILSSDQPDFLTAAKFVEALRRSGITVLRARAAFVVAGKTYPAGSLVVKTAQAFRAHVLDMFEPQDHPDDIAYPGGPPTPPYDSAGWTLAFQMGVKFDRVLDGFDGPFDLVTAPVRPVGRVIGAADAAGYFVSHHQNDAFVAVNRLLKAGEDVYWPRDRRAAGDSGMGAMYVPARSTTRPILEKAATDLGLTFTATPRAPAGEALKLQPVRIGLWDRYGGSSPSGWSRWILERFEFPFEVTYAQTLDAGNLAARYDVIILTDDATVNAVNEAPADVPAEYRGRTGVLSRARTLPSLKTFVESGGTLPVSSALEIGGDQGARPLSREQFYIPGSVLRVRVDNTTPLGYGFEAEVDVFFDRSPVFRLTANAAAKAVHRVAWFANAAPLRSGWAWGQRYLDGGIAVVDAPLGRGRVVLFGPEITFRAQPHGTFKFLFNAIYYGRAVAARLP
jgi:hypothetical protein